MISAFNEDTSMHTDLEEDGPGGYNDGSLIKLLNEHEDFQSYKNDIELKNILFDLLYG